MRPKKYTFKDLYRRFTSNLTYSGLPMGNQSPSNDDIASYLLNLAWSFETAHPTFSERWCKERPTLGQDDVTALFVQDVMGGSIALWEVEGFGSHYHNRVPHGDRFRPFTPTLLLHASLTPAPECVAVERDELLLSPQAIAARTVTRYELLRHRMEGIMLAVLDDQSEGG